MYGVPSGNQFLVRGFIQGTATQSNGSLASSDVKDFGTNPPLAGNMTGSISATAISGAVGTTSGSVGFNGTAITPANSTYDYNAAANLASITGSWTLSGLDGTTAVVTIGSNAGCSISGTMVLGPRARTCSTSVVSGASPCLAPGSTSTGISVTYLLPGSTTRELIVAGVDGARSSGGGFFGTR